jgi:exodeoxyribonuclease VII large subunit
MADNPTDPTDATGESNPTFASLFTRKAPQRRPRAEQSAQSATEEPSIPQLGLFAPIESLPEAADPLRIQIAPETAAAAARSIWTVAALVNHIRGRVEAGYADIWIEGEISNLRSAPSGHVYFTLKDGDAQLAVVLFRRQAMLLRFDPEDGMAVLVRGRVSVYESRGQLQLIAETAEPRGAGALQIAFEQLKARLAEAGLFDAERKRPLPSFPKRIGVITAASGAVIHDIVTIAARRSSTLGILIYPAAMQGESCAAEVIAGLQYFNENAVSENKVDLILIARGGGSAEDLSGFNDEQLALAIADSALPVISAIGHETDFTIADFVADLRAATPSAAAELITEAQHRVEDHIAQLTYRLARAARFQTMHARQQLSALSADSVFSRLAEGFNRRQQRVDELGYQLEAIWQRGYHEHSRRLRELTDRLHRQDIRRGVAMIRAAWVQLTQRLAHAPQRLLQQNQRAYQTAHAQLQSLSPLAVLSRGYALVFDERGMLLKSATDAPPPSIITARLAEGELQAKVLMTTKKHNS